jgi:hypothetical protein
MPHLIFDRFQTLMTRDRKTVSKAKKKKIRWSRSSSPNVAGYRLYWAISGDVGYDSEFVDIGDRREIILPDQVQPLVHVRGRVALGITALSREGNESDMARFSIHFDSPNQGDSAGQLRLGAEEWEAPAKSSVLVDDLHFWLIRNPDLQGPGQSADTRDYYVESHHVEETRR